MESHSRKPKLGTIPRSAAFSVLTTQDYQKTHKFFDVIFPKYYYWHRGFDGMYGTIARWVATLKEWNPALTEPDCFAVVKLLFGIHLPGVTKLADLENGFPDEFFDQVVFNETKRALDATGDPSKVIAWTLPAATHTPATHASPRFEASPASLPASRGEAVHLPPRPQPRSCRMEGHLQPLRQGVEGGPDGLLAPGHPQARNLERRPPSPQTIKQKQYIGVSHLIFFPKPYYGKIAPVEKSFTREMRIAIRN